MRRHPEGTSIMNPFNNTYPIAGDRAKVAGEVDTWLSSIQVGLQRLWASWAERRMRAREMGELYRFSDRELWDVGLSRSDIIGIEKGTYRRD
jgi:uncharacterized protein YjiS (DUF1127 family)